MTELVIKTVVYMVAAIVCAVVAVRTEKARWTLFFIPAMGFLLAGMKNFDAIVATLSLETLREIVSTGFLVCVAILGGVATFPWEVFRKTSAEPEAELTQAASDHAAAASEVAIASIEKALEEK